MAFTSTLTPTPAAGKGIPFTWFTILLDNTLYLRDTLIIESTWTPALKFGGASVGLTYTTQVGRVTKVGRLVTVEVTLTLTNKGTSTGAASITGLPYTASLSPAAILDCSAGMVSLTGTPFAVVSSATIFLMQTTSTARTQLDNTHFSNTSSLQFGLTFSV